MAFVQEFYQARRFSVPLAACSSPPAARRRSRRRSPLAAAAATAALPLTLPLRRAAAELPASHAAEPPSHRLARRRSATSASRPA
jgi:hypothetical protein